MKFTEIFNLQGENLAEHIPNEKLEVIGSKVHAKYLEDKQSRREWEERNAEALKIALQVKEEKSFPWQNSSNVKYPLLTMACVQYNARSYGALVTSDGPVRPVEGGDEQWNAAKRTNKYIQNNIEDWEETQDKMLLIQALIGCPIKKIYRTEDGIYSELVLPDRFVVNYYARKIKTAERKTHRLYYTKNDLEESKRMGFFRDVDLRPVHMDNTSTKDVEDEAHGTAQPMEPSGHEILEVHCDWDLDDDGYAEPYIIWLDDDSKQVLRMSTRWERIVMANKGSNVEGYSEELEKAGWKIAKIVGEEFFVKYPFIPSPDGSFYDIGFGTLLLPINEASDSLLNQLIDAGTLSNVQGGLVARNVRIRSGKVEVVPGKWVRTEANAEDLAKGIYPWPIKEPSQVLFGLLQFLLEAGERVGSVTDIMTGENPGQNQAATTTMAVLEQGMQVHNSIYKRTWRSQGVEMQMIYKNLHDMDPETYNMDEFELTADPNVMSSSQRLLKAQALKESVMQQPHLYGFEGTVEAEKRYLNALQIPGADELLAQAQPPQGDPKAEMDAQKLQLDAREQQVEAMEKQARIELESLNTQINLAKAKAVIDKTYSEIEKSGRQTDLKEAELILENVQRDVDRVAQSSGNQGGNRGTSPPNR